MEANQPENASRPARGYSLGLLFVLTAVCAVLLAMVAPIARSIAVSDIDLSKFAGALLLGSLVCSIIGGIIGTHHYRRLLGIFTGIWTGIILGAVVGPLTLIPPQDFTSLLMAAIGGVLVLLIVGATLRLSSQQRIDAAHRLPLVGANGDGDERRIG